MGQSTLRRGASNREGPVRLEREYQRTPSLGVSQSSRIKMRGQHTLVTQQQICHVAHGQRHSSHTSADLRGACTVVTATLQMPAALRDNESAAAIFTAARAAVQRVPMLPAKRADRSDKPFLGSMITCGLRSRQSPVSRLLGRRNPCGGILYPAWEGAPSVEGP